MKKLVIGILAHVDAGKTTLSEALLYRAGSIRRLGRVDNRDAFLDNNAMERERGITIFSKQAELAWKDMEMTLLDTPGHVDFSAEMERTLGVIDYGILVISGADGIQGHTATLWGLLEKYQVPVFLFINKMDQPGTDREELLRELSNRLSGNCVDFSQGETQNFYEEAAMCEEAVLESFLEEGTIDHGRLAELIKERRLFPCYFGSALKLEGVWELLEGLSEYTTEPSYPEKFGARAFKIARDDQGNRLTYLKITGGSLKVKASLKEEKVNQIRIYSGEKYEVVKEAFAGSVCAVTGPAAVRPGEGLGIEASAEGRPPVLEPMLTYRVLLPEDCDGALLLPKLFLLEEEEPMLHILWKEEAKEIQVQLMGEVQLEILKRLISERFGIEVSFDEGSILYKETILNTVEGVGHFEPLRHYAEVHLILEPLEPGRGLVFDSVCSEDILDRSWQRLILAHLQEKEHRGVLTGAPITDMKITLAAGRAHLKHTEGGDFRQAAYRAVRQGLMEAESVLLEPYCQFRLELPKGFVGRAMADMERMRGAFDPPIVMGEEAVLTGRVPGAAINNYQQELMAYTKGSGRLFLTFQGYEPCHNEEQIIEEKAYDAQRDQENPSFSVFCSHGAGFNVPWNEVKTYMHIDSVLEADREKDVEKKEGEAREELCLGTEEVDAIIEKTFYANRGNKGLWNKRKRPKISQPPALRSYQPRESREEYLLVDGYNIIFAWEELAALAKDTIDGARGRLMELLSDYQGSRGCHLMLVFDAYRLEGHKTEVVRYHNIYVVYTKEAETADQYIEKFAHENARKYKITVATSDGLEQVIIRGQGCNLLSARELLEELTSTRQRLRQDYLEAPRTGRSFLLDGISGDIKKKLQDIREGKESENDRGSEKEERT